MPSHHRPGMLRKSIPLCRVAALLVLTLPVLVACSDDAPPPTGAPEPYGTQEYPLWGASQVSSDKGMSYRFDWELEPVTVDEAVQSTPTSGEVHASVNIKVFVTNTNKDFSAEINCGELVMHVQYPYVAGLPADEEAKQEGRGATFDSKSSSGAEGSGTADPGKYVTCQKQLFYDTTKADPTMVDTIKAALESAKPAAVRINEDTTTHLAKAEDSSGDDPLGGQDCIHEKYGVARFIYSRAPSGAEFCGDIDPLLFEG